MSGIELVLYAQGEAATHHLAATLARMCHSGDCILLRGDLGAGKTTFARGFIQALAATQEEVVSPTFTLVQTYPVQDGAVIWHFDLYRLRRPEELAEIGLDEALAQGITLIEWPDIAQSELPASALGVNIAPGESPLARRFTFHGEAPVWQERLAQLGKAIA